MSAPAGFGARLRAEREARGVGLEELSRATKIRKVLLEALEGERWEELPSRVFLVGYIRAVAGHLHLDAEALCAELAKAQGRGPSAEAPGPAPERAEPEPAGGRWLPGALGAALLVAAAGGGIWFYLRPVEEPPPMPAPTRAAEPLAALAQRPAPPADGEGAPPASEPAAPVATAPVTAPPPALTTPSSAPSPAATDPVPAPSPAVLWPAAPPAPATPPAPPPPKASAAPSKPTGDLFLEVSGPCWMVLYRGEERLVYREVQAGERLSFDGGPFTLTAGDASVVKAFWKGRAVGLPEKPGAVVKEMRFGEVQDEPPGR